MKQHRKLAPAALTHVARGAATTGGAFSGFSFCIMVGCCRFFFLYCGSMKTALATQLCQTTLYR